MLICPLDLLIPTPVLTASLMDFGYNQVSIDLKDQHKIAFVTTWEVFAYQKMSFGLTNTPATFQRLMSTTFTDYLCICLEIFLELVPIFSTVRTSKIPENGL